MGTGFGFIGGRTDKDSIIKEAHLELLPVAPAGYTGAIGTEYKYRLVWAYTFQREGYRNTWEMLVDAHSGEVVSFQDLNQYIVKKIVGAIYPAASDECCPDGCAVGNSGIGYADTGLAAPNNYASLNGLFDYTSGTVQTTLTARYADITDVCGTLNESSTTGDIDLGGTVGQHDCVVPIGHSPGDTFSSRMCATQVAQITRQAAGWVSYAWLGTAVPCNVNLNSTCSAFWNGTSINFYRSGGGCRSTGESAGDVDHEWSHCVDYYDGSGASLLGEATADILMSLRLYTSCIGRGFFWTLDRNCGQWVCPTTPLSTGYNCNGYGDCCLNCMGIRDIDYAKHVSGVPHTPMNFICPNCGGGGPCGKEVHCENAPSAEPAWDLATRDLQAVPFNMERHTAFEIATRIIYLGSAGVTNWYTCNCTNSTSGGCGASNGYMQFITKDDDDGNLTNGTPHMTAIYTAFNRHGTACAAPTPQNSGCVSGPSQAAVLTATTSSNGVQLSWTAVAGAASYRVNKTIGIMRCDLGKIRIATTSGTSYTDEAMDCNQNNYKVMPVGRNPSCLVPASNCVSVVPLELPPANVTATASGLNEVTVSWSPVTGAIGYNIYRKYTVCGSVTTEKIADSITTTLYIDSPVSGGLTYYYWVVELSSVCGEGSKSDWVPVVPTGDCALMPCFNGLVSATNNETVSCGIRLSWNEGTSSCSIYPEIKYDIYRSTDPAFVPGAANMIASCITGTVYDDYAVSYSIKYYYVVRAEDNRTGGTGPCNGGDIDSNIVSRSALPTGPYATLFGHDMR